jgi:hypothetical protein
MVADSIGTVGRAHRLKKVVGVKRCRLTPPPLLLDEGLLIKDTGAVG